MGLDDEKSLDDGIEHTARQDPFHQTRLSAFCLVLLSGGILFCLSIFLQVVAWELRGLLESRFGWSERELPWVTAWFIDLFGYRPDSYLTFVVWWFWWPIVGSFGYCHARYPHPSEFCVAFLSSFIYCWMLFIGFLSNVLVICSIPFIILLAELHESPAIALVIQPISWLLPIATLIVFHLAWRRYRGKVFSRTK